jgi:Skp family chaperone for outer membrane proteins
MRLRSILFSLIAIGGLCTPALAAESIAIVNIQEIMKDSTAAKSIKDQLEAKQKTFQAEMSKKSEALQKEEQDLGKQRSVLSPDAWDKKANAFKAKAADAQKEVQSKRAELDNAFSSALNEIQKTVFDIVSGIAKDKGYSVVLPTSQLLYADSSLDITKTVLTKLNSTLPKVTVNFKAAASSKDDE